MVNKNIDVSIVVPLLNEQDNIAQLYSQINEAMQNCGGYEIVFVDDGSTDDSFRLLSEIHKKDSNVKIIRFRRNFGQTAALSAGFAHAGVTRDKKQFALSAANPFKGVK